MKVGQWIRYENNIVQLKGYCDCEQCIKRGFEEPIFSGDVYVTKISEWVEILKKCKVADTPQELIEVGDLVLFEWSDSGKQIGLIELQSDIDFLIQECTIYKIYTLQVKDYIYQWGIE